MCVWWGGCFCSLHAGFIGMLNPERDCRTAFGKSSVKGNLSECLYFKKNQTKQTPVYFTIPDPSSLSCRMLYHRPELPMFRKDTEKTSLYFPSLD